MAHFGSSTKPPRLSELWDALVIRLDSVRMQAVLGGAGRIFKQSDTALKDRPAAELAPGRRVVIVPVRTPWNTQELGSRHRVVRFLVVGEMQRGGEKDDPTVTLEAIQDEAFVQLEGWRPSDADLLNTHAGDGAAAPLLTITLPMYRHRSPQAAAEWDERSGLYFMSSEFHATVGPPA